MSDRNKAILQRANAAVERGDSEGFLAYCTDDVVWTFVGEQTLTGKDAVRQYMSATYLEPPKFVVARVIAEDDYVTAVGEISIKSAGGTVVRSEYCDVWRIHDGKLAELKAFVVEIKD